MPELTTAPGVVPDVRGGCNTHCPHGGECSLEAGHEADHQAKTADGRVRCSWPRQRPEAASGCEAADMFICADEVQEGDLMLHQGLLCEVESIQEDYSRPAYAGFVLRHADLPNGWQHAMILRHRLAAVRRYVITED